MALQRKKQSLSGFWRELRQGVVGRATTAPREWLLGVREKLRDLPKTNFDLGCRFAAEEQWYDALFRFHVTLYLQPNYPQALYNLGCCYFKLGKMAKAQDAFKRVLRDTPQNRDAVFMLAAIDPEAVPVTQRPTRMPPEIVTGFFASIADQYNQIEAENQYRGGVAVAEELKPLLPAAPLVFVDLGCGTGIASIPYLPLASEIVGVDLTPTMVAQARQLAQGDRALFTQVIEGDITALDPTFAVAADVVLLVNVVQFIGALDQVFTQAQRLLKTGGLLVLTVEPYVGSGGYGLTQETGRFGHSAAYVLDQAAAFGLHPVKQRSVMLYPESSAELFILQKGGM